MTALGTQSDTYTQVQDPQPPQNQSALLTAHQNWYNLNYCIQKRTGSCWERGLQIRTRLYPIPEAIHDALTLNRYALGLVLICASCDMGLGFSQWLVWVELFGCDSDVHSSLPAGPERPCAGVGDSMKERTHMEDQHRAAGSCWRCHSNIERIQ